MIGQRECATWPKDDCPDCIAGRELWFPVLLGGVVAIVVAGVRVVSGVGFGGPKTSNGFFPLGMFVNEHDNLQYVAWCRQAAEGHWLFDDRFTCDPHAAAVFHPLFLLAGRLASVFHSVPMQVMVVMSMASIPILLAAAYVLARHVGLTVLGARCAAVILAAGSGVSDLAVLLWKLVTGAAAGDVPGWLYGADRDHMDALFFPTFVEYPFIAICYTLMTIQCCILAVCDKQARVGIPSRPLLVVLCLLTCLLGLSHPYEHVLISAGYLAAITAEGVISRPPRTAVTRRLPVAGVVAGTSACVFAYYFWLSCLPVWRDVAAQSLYLPTTRSVWIFGYGALLPLAVVGIAIVWRAVWRCCREETTNADRCAATDLSRASWLGMWSLLFLIPLVGFEMPRSKLCAGGYLPLAILGGIALDAWYRAGCVDKSRVRWQHKLAWSLAWVLLLQGTAWQVARFCRSGVRMRSEVLELAAHLDRESAGRTAMTTGHYNNFLDRSDPPKILAPPPLARVLVAFAGVRVYCGNIYKTPDYATKEVRLEAAGILPPVGVAVDLNEVANELTALVAESHADYVVTAGHVPADDVFAAKHITPLLFGCFNLYPIRNPKESLNPHR